MNRLKYLARKRAYYQQAQWSRYAIVNRDKLLLYKKSYRAKNPGYMALYRETNKEKIRACRRAYNRAQRQKNADYIRERMRRDSACRVRSRLRSRIWHAIRNQNARPSGQTLALVGCSINFLKVHLEARFKPGMSWDNYGLLENKSKGSRLTEARR